MFWYVWIRNAFILILFFKNIVLKYRSFRLLMSRTSPQILCLTFPHPNTSPDQEHKLAWGLTRNAESLTPSQTFQTRICLLTDLAANGMHITVWEMSLESGQAFQSAVVPVGVSPDPGRRRFVYHCIIEPEILWVSTMKMILNFL